MGLKLGSVNIPAVRVTGGITPTGTINIDENGSWDVSQFAWAEVDVPSGSSMFQVSVEDENGHPIGLIPAGVSETGVTYSDSGWFIAGAIVCMPMHDIGFQTVYEIVSVTGDVVAYFYDEYDSFFYFIMPSSAVTVVVTPLSS